MDMGRLATVIKEGRPVRPNAGHFVMAVVLVVLGFFLIWPALLLLINSFNVARDWFVGPRVWGLANWTSAWDAPGLFVSLGNSFLIWILVFGISFPIAVVISWTLARTNIPLSRSIEFVFWLSYMMPSLSTTIAWLLLLDPVIGLFNTGIKNLPFVDQAPFNIYSVPGIVWTHIMANGIALKVMLLTPAFRNMDASMEEAARVSGASNISTMIRVTLPLMVSPMVLVFALQLLRIFQSFETELLLGTPIGFFVYSTKIYEFARVHDPPQYGFAMVLASLTLLLVAVIIPLQRWILQRRRYTTITGSFRPGLINLGMWKWVVFGVIGFLLVLLTIGPVFVLILGSFMTRAGLFFLDPVFTLDHWQFVLTDRLFLRALRTTLVIATTAAIVSPLLFSVLAYLLVRTRLPGRFALDTIIWTSGAMPGMLTGLGLLWLFIGTPGLSFLYGSTYALIIVVVLQGNTLGVNILKGVLIQVGQDMEDAARVAGAGWIRTYFRVWIPLLMPTITMLAVINFTLAAGTTSSIILLASRDTVTLSLMALEFAQPIIGMREEASIIAVFLILLTSGLAAVGYTFGIRMNVRHG